MLVSVGPGVSANTIAINKDVGMPTKMFGASAIKCCYAVFEC